MYNAWFEDIEKNDPEKYKELVHRALTAIDSPLVSYDKFSRKNMKDKSELPEPAKKLFEDAVVKYEGSTDGGGMERKDFEFNFSTQNLRDEFAALTEGELEELANQMYNKPEGWSLFAW